MPKANPEISANSSMPFSRAVPVDHTPSPHASAKPAAYNRQAPATARATGMFFSSIDSEIGPAAQEASAAPINVATAIPAMRNPAGMVSGADVSTTALP